MRRVGSTPTSGTKPTYDARLETATTLVDARVINEPHAAEVATRASHQTRLGPADILVFVGFIGIPLAVSPVLGDQFTGVKWYVLELLAIVWVLIEVLARKATPSPGFVRRHAKPLVALAGLTIVNSLRGGLEWAVEPLLARGTFVALAWCAYAHFSRNGLRTQAIQAALTVSSIVVIAVGLAQVLGLTRAMGLEPLLGLPAGDGRSATFGNVNMAAQFVGFALTVLVAHRAAHRAPAPRWRSLASDVLVATGLGYVFAVGSRSAMLASAASFAVIAVLTRRRGVGVASRRPLFVAAVVAVSLIGVAWSTGRLSGAPPFGAADHPLKAESLRLRSRLWKEAAELVRDHPLGVGSGNFAHAFLPYQLQDERLRSETIVYSSPHNEPLRALSEEGVPWCALAGYLLLQLGAAVRRQARARPWPLAAVIVAGGTAFLAVESAFQFPFAMAFGCLGAAMLLGLALSFLETDGGPAVTQRLGWRPAARLATIAAALVGAFALARLVRSDYLTGTDAPDAARPHEACQLNPRNLRACLNAAWLDARAGNRQDARVRAAAILDRSPYYYPAIKLLADESLAQGDVRAGCFHLWIYDSLFDGRSAEHDRLSALCDPALLDAFRGRAAVPGYERFPLTIPAGPAS
jgi:hypothetical protein